MTEVRYLHDDAEIKLSLDCSRLKTAISGTTRSAACSPRLENPYRYLEVRGHAQVKPDNDYEFATSSAPSTART